MHEKVENIYNALFKFEAGKKPKLYPIHKKLQFEKSEAFKNYEDISDWIINNILLSKSSTILDAGCGVGYVLLKLCKTYGCKGLGISLSSDEIQAAKKNANTLNTPNILQMQMENPCEFKVQNFDNLKNGNFDLIVAIESIKHATDVQQTLKVFQQNLSEQGRIVIIEDFLQASHTNHPYTKAFSKAWHVPKVYTETEFENYAKQAGLNLTDSIALSHLLVKKNKISIRLKLWATQLSSFFIRNAKQQTKLNIYIGALIMDYFYTQQVFEYKLKVYQKQN